MLSTFIKLSLIFDVVYYSSILTFSAYNTNYSCKIKKTTAVLHTYYRSSSHGLTQDFYVFVQLLYIINIRVTLNMSFNGNSMETFKGHHSSRCSLLSELRRRHRNSHTHQVLMKTSFHWLLSFTFWLFWFIQYCLWLFTTSDVNPVCLFWTYMWNIQWRWSLLYIHCVVCLWWDDSPHL